MAHGLDVTIGKLTHTLQGWSSYFLSAIANIHQDLVGFIRRRLRSQRRKANRVNCRGNGMAHQRWPNAFSAELGFFSLAAAHRDHLQRHRHAAITGKAARAVRREGRP